MALVPAPVSGNVTVTWDSSTIGGATNFRLTNGPSLVDITSLGDLAVARYPTIKDWSVTFDLVYDVTDAGQAKLVADLYTPASHELIVNIPGSHHLTGSGWVESFDYTFDPKEVIRASVSIKGTGVLVYS
jgi:hypothetical protein